MELPKTPLANSAFSDGWLIHRSTLAERLAHMTSHPPSVTPVVTDFSGLWVPLITPFRDDRIDHPALAKLARRLRKDGVKGLVVCGSTGEAAALDAQEQREALATVLQAVPGMPVVMGLSGYHLAQTQARVRELSSLPLAGLLVPAPHYIRPSQAGLLQWFHTLADASTVPLIIYDIPYRTGATMERSTLLELACHPRIQAIKDCGGDMGKTLALIAQARLQVLAGEDLQMFACLAQGGVGAIAASAHLATAAFVQLVGLLRAGHLAPAQAIWPALVPLIEASFAEPNPGPVKCMLAMTGAIDGGLRAPMAPCSPALAAQLHMVLGALQAPVHGPVG
jgi:4-hydroxy-tetrahydrodipicolinate synthase